MILTPLQKLPNTVGNLNGCPKCKKSPNLVTLLSIDKIWNKALAQIRGGGACSRQQMTRVRIRQMGNFVGHLFTDNCLEILKSYCLI